MPVVSSRSVGWIAALPLLAGCASTVAAVADSAVDAVDAIDAADVGAAVDAGPPDVGVPVDVRRCPLVVEGDVPVADVPTDGPYVVELSTDDVYHQCARMSDGTLRCRGLNTSGELGLGREGPSEPDAVVVPGLTGVAQVITDLRHATCTRHLDGSVRCWGSNEAGLLGTGHEGDRADCRCRSTPTLVPGLTEVTRLASNWGRMCAVRRDGTVWCWGERVARPSATPARYAAFSDVSQLWAFTNDSWVARLRSGRYVWRFDYEASRDDRRPTIPDDAVMDEGNPTRVDHLCYRLPDGSVRCFGWNDHGALGNGTTSDAIFDPVDPGLCGVRSAHVGHNHSCALMGDLTVRCWGYSVTSPTPVPGLDRVDRLFPGNNGTCAIRLDRSVWCWQGPSFLGTPAPMPVRW